MESEDRNNRRAFFGGLLLWLLFCVAAVLLRGVRWDENYEFAQVLLGHVPYPEGHPLYQHVFHFLSLQPWSLAGLMALVPGPFAPNFLRNVMALAAVVLPAYLLAAGLTRRAVWGHAAALLMLMGIHQAFYSNYPVQVWPGLYSNGIAGQGWALAAFACLVTGRHRAGWLMTGLMPAVHLGQFPPLFAVAVLRLAWRWKTGSRPELRAALKWGGGGLLLSGLFVLLQHSFTVPPPLEGPYWSGADPGAVFRGYMEHHASHRAVPRGTGHIAMAMALLMSGLMAWGSGRAVSAWTGIFAYIAAVCGIVWGVMAIHLLLGPAIPWLFIGWLPYRLMNHCLPLLIPGMVAYLAVELPESSITEPRSYHYWGPAILIPAALLYGILRPLMPLLTGEVFFERYLETGEAVFFVLYGAAAALMLIARQRGRALWLFLFAAGWAGLAWKHQFGAACCAAGALSAVTLLLATRPRGTRWLHPLTYAAAAILLAVLLYGQARNRQHLPLSGFEREVRALLAARGDEDAMILVRHQQEGLQARLGHPVMTDMAALTWIPYRPALGPAIAKMYRDLYGIRIAPEEGEEAYAMPWYEVWPAKSRAEWRQLGVEYEFRYIIAPVFMDIDLPCILEGAQTNLFEIPPPGGI
jgi:hypothetical protein